MTRARDLGDFIADGAAAELVVDTTTLVVDSTNNRVGIGTASPATALDLVGNATITVADNSDALTLVSTDADANAGPILKLRRNSASPADNDLIGAIDWTSENSSGDEHDFLNLTARMRDVTAGSEDVAYAWTAYLNGTGREIQSFVNTDASAASMVFNEDSQDIDFRVESNGNANMLFVDGGNDAVGIGTNSPARSLQVDSTNNRVASFRHTDGSSAYVTFSDSSTTDDGSVRIGAIGNDLVNFVGGAERFRFGTSGQLGIGGATYGTSGQVLTSGGASAAPSWADAGGGGGTVDFTASGSLSNGDLVKLNSNGTVSVLAGGGSGSAVVFESAQINYTGSTFDSNSNKVVIAYSDAGNSYYGTAVVGTVSGTSISFGTPVVFQTAGSNYISATFDSNSNKVVIAYRGASSHGTAIVGTVSGTSISFGTAVVFESAESNYISATFDTNSNKVVIAYQDNGNSNKGTAIVGTVSGTSISFGSHAIFSDVADDSVSATFDSNSNKVVIATTGQNNYGNAVVGTVSGTSISFGSAVVFAVATTLHITSTFDSSANKVVIAFRDSSNNNYGTAIVGNVSGTSISFGDEVVFLAAPVNRPSATFDSNSNKVVIAYENGGNSSFGTVIVAKVSGTSISFGSPSVFETAETQRTTCTFDSNSNKVVIGFKDSGNSDFGTALTFTPPDISEWVGIASADASNGATATINVVSSVNEGQSGLTVGSRYYITDSGTLTTDFLVNREVGRATASTKLFITQGSVT